MAISFSKLFAPALLAGVVGNVFTMPASPSTTVLKNGRVRLTNTTAGAVSATLYAVPSGGAPSTTNMFLSAVSLAAGASLDVDVPTLAAGDQLQGFASAAASINIQEAGGVLYS